MLAALQRVASQLVAATNLRVVMETVGTELKRLGLECYITEPDPSEEALVVKYTSVRPETLSLAERTLGLRVEGFRILRRNVPIYDQLVHRRQPVFVPQIGPVSYQFAPNVPKALLDQAMRLVGIKPDTSAILLPLIIEDQVIGMLGMWGAVRPEDLPAATVFASQVAVAMRSAELLCAERGARQMAETLSAASAALARTLDLDVLLKTALDYVGRLVPNDGAAIVVLDQAGQIARGATSGAAGAVEQALAPLAPHEPFAHFLQSVLSTASSQTLASGARSWAGVPLVAGGRAIGLCAVAKRDPGYFTPDRLSLIETLASQAAIAIANAQLFDQVQAGRERMHALSARLLDVQEEERRHTARELHDEIGQSLTGLMLFLEMTASQAAQGLPVGERVNKALAMVDQALGQVRDLSLNLRPPVLDDMGLLPALLAQFERYTERTGVRVRFEHIRVKERQFAPSTETAVYRIIQEALTNAARHAAVTEVAVRLWFDGQALHAQVEDQGQGFDPDAGGAATSGLRGMRERAELAGGQFAIQSRPGDGTTLTLSVPLPYPGVDRRTAHR